MAMTEEAAGASRKIRLLQETPPPDNKQPSTLVRRIRISLAVLGAAFLLSACGATIDTEMNVADSGAGERVMSLSLPEDEVEELQGGVAAADASIRRHLPSSISYSGLEEAGDGSLEAVFTLPFSSTDDYEKKSAELLGSAGAENSGIDFSVTDSILVSGITLRENHSSADLLSWMFDGLTSDGVVSSDNSSDMYEHGKSVLNFRGSSTEQSYMFNVENVENKGFDLVEMQTEIRDPSDISRTITYTVDESRYERYKDALQAFISEATPAGAKVSTSSAGKWEMTFTGPPSVIESGTTLALGGQPADFALESGASPDDPAMNVLDITDRASCDAVCAAAGSVITDQLLAPSSYTPSQADVNTSLAEAHTLTFAPPIGSVAASYSFELDGSVSATVDFVVPEASIDAVGDGFARLFDPQEAGTLTTSVVDGSTKYTVEIGGGSVDEFAGRYAQWAPGGVSRGETGGGLFLKDFGYVVSPGLLSLTENHEVLDGATSEIVLPFGQWVRDADPGTRESFNPAGIRISREGIDAPLSVRTSGPTVGGMVGSVVALGLFAAAVVVLYRRRTLVWARLQSARGASGTLTDRLLLQFRESTGNGPAGNSSSVLDLPFEGHRKHDGDSLLKMPVPRTADRVNSSVSVLTFPKERIPARAVSLLDLGPQPPSSARPSLLS